MESTGERLSYRFGNCLIDVAARQLFRNDEAIEVQPRVFDLLVYLASHHDRMVDKDELQDAVWPGRVITETALTRAIMKARKAVGDDASQQAVIKTVHGHGYHFVAKVETLRQADEPADMPVATPAEKATGDRTISVWLGVMLSTVLLLGVLWKWLEPAHEPEAAATVPGPQPPAMPISRQSIAVLPFANRSNRAEDQFFTDGIHDDLLTNLAKVGSLKVISRTSVMRYRDTELAIPQIAGELGVAHILEGGIQRSGDHVRINVQLIDAATDDHLWAEIYDRELNVDNLFAIQSEISHEIVQALHAALDAEESQRLGQQPTNSLEAYGEFVLGRQALALRSAGSLEQAREHFRRATEIDPDYTLAYVGQADALNLLQTYSAIDAKQSHAERQQLIDRALGLNPESGEAWTSLAALRVDQSRFEEAEEYFLKAISLNPGYSTAHHWYAYLLENTGRSEEALPLIREALELDPMAPILATQYARVLWNLGRVDEANAALIDGIRRNPHFASYYMNMATNLRELGRLGESMMWIQAGLALDNAPSYIRIAECKRWLDFDQANRGAACLDAVERDHPGAAPGSRVEQYQFEGDFGSALQDARVLAERFPRHFAWNILGWNYLYNGAFEDALTLVEAQWPYLLSSDPSVLPPPADLDSLHSLSIAGLALYSAGAMERANALLDSALQAMQAMPRVRGEGYSELDVVIHAWRGDNVRAVAALREAVDSGWRDNWWRLRFPIYDDLATDPQWQALVTELENDAHRQARWFEANREQPLISVSRD